MAIELVEDSGRQWLIATASGGLTLEDVLEFMKSARAPVERRMTPLLFDARGATTTMTAADVDEAAALAQKAVEQGGPRGHVALVAEDNWLYECMVRYETLCTEAGISLIRVFRQRADAELWLQTLSAARYFR